MTIKERVARAETQAFLNGARHEHLAFAAAAEALRIAKEEYFHEEWDARARTILEKLINDLQETP